MKIRIAGSILATSLVLIAATAQASVLHIWECQMNEGKTGADVVAVSEAWLAAARSMDGGADLAVYLDVPLAASASDGRFNWVLEAEDAKTWGVFMNGYEGSAAEEADLAFIEVATCSGSSLWNSSTVE